MATASAADLLGFAEQQLGRPYVYGAAGPSSFDCSGLVSYVFGHFGITLPHHAADQAAYGSAVETGAIQPGDLVFSNWGDGPDSHVGIAVSATQIIDAPKPGTSVRYDTLTDLYKSKITSVRRLDQVTGAAGAVAGAVGSAATALDPLALIADAIGKGLSPLTQVSTVGDWLMRATLPSTVIRAVALLGGMVFIGWGTILLAREVRK